MKAIARAVLASSIATSAAAQDVSITIDPFVGTISAQYNGFMPLIQIFNSIAIRLSGDAPITITSQSNVYTSILTPGGAEINGNGTNVVEFIGEAPGALLGATVNSSNPFSPFTFSYSGSFSSFNVEFFSQTSIIFVQAPFGNPINLVNADGSQGPLTFTTFPFGPPNPVSPGTAALLGIAGVVGARRRR